MVIQFHFTRTIRRLSSQVSNRLVDEELRWMEHVFNSNGQFTEVTTAVSAKDFDPASALDM